MEDLEEGPALRPGTHDRTSARPNTTPPGELEPNEELLVVLRGIGASMFLTTRHLIIARDGVARRPRSGLQTFRLESIRHIRIEMGSAPSGRIAVWTTDGHEALSMFFDAKSLDRAHELLDLARPLIARSRRDHAKDDPASSPVRPADEEPARPPDPSDPLDRR